MRLLQTLLVLLFSAMSAQVDAVTHIIKDSRPLGQIHLPASSGRATQFAAQELQQHLREMTGAEVALSWRDPGLRDGGYVLSIRPEDEWKGRESSQAFVIEQVATPHPVVTIRGNTDLAVLYGVYQYLGDLGVRWLAPGDLGTNLPRTANIAIVPGSHSYSPAFISRTLALSSTANNHFGGVTDLQAETYDYELYLLRNRTQFGRNIAGKSFDFNWCGTASGHAIKPMTGLTREAVKAGLMEKEPERFALVTGGDFVQKRRYEDGQVCFTNETNIATAIENCIAFFQKLEDSRATRGSDLDEDYTVPMGLSDCWGICECAACQNVAGEGPYRKDRLVWSFWNRVARGLNEAMPGRKIAVHCPYMDLAQPPADVTIEPNVMVVTPLVYSWEKTAEHPSEYGFPATAMADMAAIRQAGATLGCYNYLNFPWSPTPLFLLDAASTYAAEGYRHYHLEAMQRTEYTWPLIWVLAQFTWDSSTDPHDYLKSFCTEYYGEAPGANVLWILQEMTRHSLEMERIVFGSASDTSTMLPDGLIEKARALLRSDIRHSQGKEQERLRRFSIAMDTQFQLAQTYRAYVRALGERSDAAIADLEKRANELQQFWDSQHVGTINTTARTPKVAAATFLKTDFASLKPAARKELAGLGPTDERWLKELFAGEAVPETIPDLVALPELWKFRLDVNGEGLAAGWVKPDFDDSTGGWQELSTWNWVEGQGYAMVDGYFCYRLRFQAPEFPADKQVFLRIGSLDDSGDIYLNGIRVGSQADPRNWDRSFEMDITQAIHAGGDNVLVVYGYDSSGGAGIWRPSGMYTQ